MGDKRAAFLDRDGVVNPLVPNRISGSPDSPHHPDDLRLHPGVTGAIRRLREAGFLVVLISNQPSAARGKCTLADLDAVHARLVSLLAAAGNPLDGAYYCHHDPLGVVRELAVDCACRKPKPGLIVRAARDLGVDLAASWMIGDRAKDVECGRRAGCRTILAGGADASVVADHVAPDLDAASRWLVTRCRR